MKRSVHSLFYDPGTAQWATVIESWLGPPAPSRRAPGRTPGESGEPCQLVYYRDVGPDLGIAVYLPARHLGRNLPKL